MRIKIYWPLLFVAIIILAAILIFPSDLRLAALLGKAGKWQEAIQNYQKVLDKHPNRDDIRIELANIYILNNRPEKALMEYERAGADITEDPVQLNKLYQLYSSLGDKVKTIATLKKLVNLTPENASYRTKLAEAYEWNNDTDNAIARYDELLYENPADIHILNKLIYLNLNKKDYGKTSHYLKTLLNLQPENQEARILLGNVYLQAKQKELAASEFEQVLKIDPQNESQRLQLAELYLWIPRYEKARLHYEYLFMTHVLNDHYFNKLIDLTKNNDPAKAIKYYKYRLKYLPHDNELRAHFVDLYLYLGQTDEAVAQMQNLVANNPQNARYWLKLAKLYATLREPQQANEIFETMFYRGHQNSDITRELINYYKNEQHYDKLLKLYATLVQANKATPNMQHDYAEILLRTHHYEAAQKQYLSLLKRQPQNLQIRMQLANLYQFKKEDKDALKLIKQGIEKYAIRDEEYLFYAGQLFAEHNQHKESIACFKKLTALDKHNIQYKKLLAAQYIKTKKFKKATQLYGDILRQHPATLDMKLELASLYWLQNDFDRMHKITRTILASETENEHLHQKLGQFYFERAFLNDAIEHLKIAQQSSPIDSATLRMLGLAYAWNNQPVQSKQILNKYHHLYQNDYYTHYQLGALLISAGDKKKAWREFQTSLSLLENVPESIESAIVKGQIFTYLNAREQAMQEFERLIAKYPGNLAIYNDYAESLLNLKDYDRFNYWTNKVLKQEPNNYRALRLKSRAYFEQGKYKQAAKILTELAAQYAPDIGVKIDLVDAKLASGDWYQSTKILQEILQKYPNTVPAQERLRLLRREQSQAFSSNYEYETESGNFFKQIYNVVLSKVVYSFFHLKFLFGEETYSTKDFSFDDDKYSNLGVEVTSRYNSIGINAQKQQSEWNFSGKGMLRWYFSPSNYFTISSALNELWNDPLIATFYQGRRYNLKSDVNLYLLNRIFFWNRFSYESHSIHKNKHFGDALRTYFQLGYVWRQRPQFLTYYQFYNLNYHYQNAANRNLILIRDRESVHYLGAALNQQLTPKLYYQLGGSIGFNTIQDNMLFYGTFDLEYMLMNRIRLRSHFVYGNQSRLAGNNINKSVSFDLFYFY